MSPAFRILAHTVYNRIAVYALYEIALNKRNKGIAGDKLLQDSTYIVAHNVK